MNWLQYRSVTLTCILLVHSAALAQVVPNCKSRCLDPNFHQCVKITSSTNFQVAKGFNSLLALAIHSSPHIQKGDVMSIFGVSTDPCLRTGTWIENGVAINRGLDCHLTTPIDFGVGPAVTVTLSLPRLVEGKVYLTPEYGQIVFTDESKAPELHISNQFLEPTWGGTVTTLESASNVFFLQTRKGRCLALSATQ